MDWTLNSKHNMGFSRAMLVDCSNEMLRMENHITNKKSKYLLDMSKSYFIIFISIGDKILCNRPLKQQNVYDILNSKNTKYQKWDNMISKRKDRIDQTMRIQNIRKHQYSWPIYKYSHEK
jgi:hypothetical protein